MDKYLEEFWKKHDERNKVGKIYATFDIKAGDEIGYVYFKKDDPTRPKRVFYLS